MPLTPKGYHLLLEAGDSCTNPKQNPTFKRSTQLTYIYINYKTHEKMIQLTTLSCYILLIFLLRGTHLPTFYTDIYRIIPSIQPHTHTRRGMFCVMLEMIDTLARKVLYSNPCIGVGSGWMETTNAFGLKWQVRRRY